MINKKNLAEIFGWYGTITILLAYLLVSFNIIATNGYLYQILNLTGAIGIVVISIAKKVNQSTILNVLWAIIALVAIISLIINN